MFGESDLPRAVFVALVELIISVLAEDLLALFAGEDNLTGPIYLVILRFRVAQGAVEPLLAALCVHLYLRVQNVFAHPI